jgi:hypothetical protein
LPGFCRIEIVSGGTPLMWLPLWAARLPKIGRGGPVYYAQTFLYFAVMISVHTPSF